MILNFNNIQRISFFITILACLTTVMLHFPFGGYANTTYYEENMNHHLCPSSDQLASYEKVIGRELTDEEFLERTEYCYTGKYKTLPFSEWRTNDPIFYWFGSIVHTLSAIVFFILSGLVFIVVFKDREIYRKAD